MTPNLYMMQNWPQTLTGLIATAINETDRDLLVERNAAGKWVTTRSHAFRDRVIALAMGLRSIGVAPGDRVAIASPNRIDWLIANCAIVHAGAVTVPLFATQAHDQVRYIIDDSEARVAFVDTPARRAAFRASGIAIERVIAFDDEAASVDSLAALEATGRRAAARESGALAMIADQISPDDLAMLIYTSGTTGQPKGVMLTHRNIASNAIDAFARAAHVLRPADRVLSILPFAHIYENTNIYGYLLCASVVYINAAVENLVDDLRSVRPATILGVPRIFERVLISIVSRARAGGGARARIVPWALRTGREYMRAKTTGKAIGLMQRVRFTLARKLALDKIKPLLGLDQLKICGSGSAPLHPDTALTFLGFAVSISEGYGLTECSPVVTVNEPTHPQIGSVGQAIANVELKLAHDGELLVRGPGVMKGYYHDAEATARTITEGWLHTGDIATIGANGYVRIVDRKNELFKTSGGKYIAPARIESAMSRSLYFNQVMVLGAGRPHPVAFVSPNWLLLRAELGLEPAATPRELAARTDVRRFLEAEALRQTDDLGPFERIHSIGVLPRDLTIEDGELSPTQKIKRRVVEARFCDLIERPAPVPA